MDGLRNFASFSVSFSVPSLFTILPRFWVCKIVFWNFLISYAQSMQCLPFCLFLYFFLRVAGLILSLFHRLSLSLLLCPCPHRLSLFLFPCTFNFNVTQIPKYKSIQPNFSKLIHISYPDLRRKTNKKNLSIVVLSMSVSQILRAPLGYQYRFW